VLKSKVGLAKPGTNSLKTTIGIVIIVIILGVGGFGAYVIFEQGRGNSQQQTTVRDWLKIISSPTDTPEIVIPGIITKNCAPYDVPYVYTNVPYVYADVLNLGPSTMTGVAVYINGQLIYAGPFSEDIGYTGPGAVVRIIVFITNGMNLVPGQTYTLTIVGKFADGTSATTSTHVIAVKVCG